jgi:hypothetical protein
MALSKRYYSAGGQVLAERTALGRADYATDALGSVPAPPFGDDPQHQELITEGYRKAEKWMPVIRAKRCRSGGTYYRR